MTLKLVKSNSLRKNSSKFFCTSNANATQILEVLRPASINAEVTITMKNEVEQLLGINYKLLVMIQFVKIQKTSMN